MLKVEYYQKMRELQEANIALERELLAEKQANKAKPSENMITELTKSYEEKLTEAKRLAKKATDENARLMEELKHKDSLAKSL